MNHNHRCDTPTRIKALEAGQWQTGDGTFIPVADMPDMHLLNALLKALREEEPTGITHPLAAEVCRRGLEEKAAQMAYACNLWRNAS